MVFLPGFAGSRLSAFLPGWDHGVDVWLGIGGLPLGGYRALDLSGTLPEALGVEIRPDGPLLAIYAEFLSWARNRWDQVVTVSWDWRHRYDASAASVAATLDQLAGDGHSLTLIGHSAGGLLAAAASRIWSGTVQARMRHVVTIGCPWRGSWRAVESLLGKSDVVRTMALLSAVARTRLPWRELGRIRDVLATFPGLYDLFPWPSLMDEVGLVGMQSPWNLASWTNGGAVVHGGHLATSFAATAQSNLPTGNVAHLNIVGVGQDTAGPHADGGDFDGYSALTRLHGDGVVSVQSASLPAAAGRSEITVIGSHAHLCSAVGTFVAMSNIL